MAGTTSPSDNPKNFVGSVGKAFAVLHAFRADDPVLSVSEVAASSGLDRGTAFRLLHTLVSLGYVRRVSGKRFRLTLKCLELGYSSLTSQELWDQAEPLLEECVPELVDAASLGVLEGDDIYYLKRVDVLARRELIDARPGRRMNNHASALAHTILAWLPEERQIEILESQPRMKLSEHTLTELPELLGRLREVRQRGYAVSDGENAYGLRTIAVPVHGEGDSTVAGVSLTVDSVRMPLAELLETGLPRAMSIAAELSRALTHLSGSASTLPAPTAH